MTSLPFRSDWKWRAWRVGWLLAVAWIFIYGAVVRFALPQWPLIAPDSFIYLNPSINGGIYSIGPRTFVYPMFCRTVLQVTQDWRSIVAVQHFLGLLGPALLLLAWTSLGARIWSSRPARAIHDTIGIALPLLLVLSSPYVAYEQQVLLESMNAFLQCCLGTLLCLQWIPRSSARRIGVACGTAALGILMYYGNPRWGPSAVVVLALAILAVTVPANPLRRRFAAGGLVLASGAAAYLGFATIQSRLVLHDSWDDTFTAKVLLWMHADLAVNEFRRDLAAPHPPSYAPLLRKMIPKIEKEIVGYEVSHWRTITFNANALLYIPDNPDGDLVIAFKNNPEGYKRFCLEYYQRIIVHQPQAFWGEVGFLLRYYYHGRQDDGAFREFIQPVTDYFPNSAALARELAEGAVPASRPPLAVAAKALDRVVTPPGVLTPLRWYDPMVRLIHVLFLLITVAGAAAAIMVLLWPRLRKSHALAVLAWLCLGAVSALFAQVLTLAMVTVTEGRYADALRTLAVFSLVCAFAMVTGLVVGVCTGLKPQPAPAA